MRTQTYPLPMPRPATTRSAFRSLLLPVLLLGLTFPTALCADAPASSSSSGTNTGMVLSPYEGMLTFVSSAASLNTGQSAPVQAPRPRNRDEALRFSAAHLRLGKAWLADGRLEEARKEFDTAVECLLDTPIDFSNDAEARTALENLIQEIHRVDVTQMGLGASPESPVYQESPLEQIPEQTFPVDPSLVQTIVDQIRARTSEFPLELDENVLSYVRYFTSERGKRTFVAGHRRSGKYRDMILRILDEEGLPRELIHLAQAESGFLPRAMSRAKAGGLWQFIVYSGKEYGLMQTTYTDDRFDPERATRAAARHLRDLFHQFGDWNLAMAAYNCGPYCVERAVERTGYADFWELRRLGALPKETTNYVPIVQALAIISLNPAAYGIELPEMDPPLLFDTHVLEAKTHLRLVSDLLGITQAEIRELNPAVKGDIAPAGYALRVPKQTVPTLLSGLSAIPETNRVAWRAHRVNDGETLTTIAKRYNSSSNAIAKANSVSDSAVQAGDLLLIPATYTTPKKRTATRRKATAKTTSKARTTRKTSTTKKTSSKATPQKAAAKASPKKAATSAKSTRTAAKSTRSAAGTSAK